MNPVMLTRRGLLARAAIALTGAPAVAFAQRSDALRIIVGYPPGGSLDVVARKLAEKLAGHLSTGAVVENRPGAAGRLGIDELKRAAAGSALLITPASTLTMYPHVYRQLSYDPFTDLAPVSTVATTAFALAIGPAVPARVDSLEALRRWCRERGAARSCGNAGAGSMPHFMSLLAAREWGIELAPIPYRGGLAAMQAVAAGEVEMAIATEGSARSLHQAGRLRVVATSWDRRSPFFPDAPTFSELGAPGVTHREWYGAFMPSRTGEAHVQSLVDAIRSHVQDGDVRETWERAGLGAEALGPAALRDALRSEHDFWGPVVRSSGFTPEA